MIKPLALVNLETEGLTSGWAEAKQVPLSFTMTVSFLVYCLAGFSSPSHHAGGPSIRFSPLEEQDGLAWDDYKISVFESSSTAT